MVPAGAWGAVSCVHWAGVQVSGGKQWKARLEEKVELSIMG